MQNYKFIPEFESFYQKIKDGEILTKRGERYAYGSAYTWKTALYNFRRYEEFAGQPLYMADVDTAFVYSLVKYLNSRNLTKNSVGCILKRLYAFANHCFNRHLHLSFERLNLWETTRPVYNTLEEIESLLSLPLYGTEERIRDIYVLQCNLGLRYSDMLRLLETRLSDRIHHNGVGYILKLTTLKTREEVDIPIRSQALGILEKYHFGRIAPPCIVTVNRRIKGIARQAGIDSTVVLSGTRGGLFSDTFHKKYEKMCTHTARRSFATNAFLAGVNTRSIMLITGHATEASFRRYIGATNLENAISLQSHPFFA